MKTVVLDDDPTGTQSATGVEVLLDFDVDQLTDVLGRRNAVYVQTNSRAISEAEAIGLVGRVREAALEAGERIGQDIQFVLRGDSTLRGHVFAESAVFATPDSVLLFVPAFPDGGRTTRDGVHYATIGDKELPAHETEYADDPVFGFRNAQMTAYVEEKTGTPSRHVALDAVRGGTLEKELLQAPGGAVITADAITNADIAAIARAVEGARDQGRRVVVRSAAPLAAELAGVVSAGLLPSPLLTEPQPTLLVCGSHTAGATSQLEAVEARFGGGIQIDTDRALADPTSVGAEAAEKALAALKEGPLAIVSSSRDRLPQHNTLEHGRQVMAALTTAVQDLAPHVEVVVAKGGITSADVARVGLGVTRAWVVGQVLPGISVWRLEPEPGRELLYVVVPGNVGGPDTLVQVLELIGVAAA